MAWRVVWCSLFCVVSPLLFCVVSPLHQVVSSLDAIIVRYGEGIAPHAVDLVKTLAGLWKTYAEDGEAGDDEAALSAEHCLQVIVSVLPLSKEKPDMYRPMEALVMPLISRAFDPKAKRVEQLDSAIYLLNQLAFVPLLPQQDCVLSRCGSLTFVGGYVRGICRHCSPVPFSEVMWHAFNAMLGAFFVFADDYINHVAVRCVVQICFFVFMMHLVNYTLLCLCTSELCRNPFACSCTATHHLCGDQAMGFRVSIWLPRL